MTKQELLLNKLRHRLEPTITKLGAFFATSGLSADFWTILSLIVSFTAGIVYALASIGLDWYISVAIGGALLLVSGFFDIVDGSVARTTKRTSRRGAFLDSSFDKIAESAIFIGIALGHLAPALWCMIGLTLSLLVSYTRARADSLGVELRGIGVGERAERLLMLALIGIVLPLLGIHPSEGPMFWALITVSVAAGITLIHRIIFTARKL